MASINWPSSPYSTVGHAPPSNVEANISTCDLWLVLFLFLCLLCIVLCTQIDRRTFLLTLERSMALNKYLLLSLPGYRHRPVDPPWPHGTGPIGDRYRMAPPVKAGRWTWTNQTMGIRHWHMPCEEDGKKFEIMLIFKPFLLPHSGYQYCN